MADRTPTTLTTQVTNTTPPLLWGNGVKSWADFLKAMDSCRVYNSAAISIANSTSTALTFNSERFDNNALHSTSSNTGRITCQTPGLYVIGACAEFANNATGNRAIFLRLNGTTTIGRDTDPAMSIDHSLHVEICYRLAATDYVEVLVFQSSGGALNVQAAANYSPEFWACQIGV